MMPNKLSMSFPYLDELNVKDGESSLYSLVHYVTFLYHTIKKIPKAIG